MKLYYAPGACSLSPHIVLREAGLPFELQKVSTKTKKMDDSGDFLQTNSKVMCPHYSLTTAKYLLKVQRFCTSCTSEINWNNDAGSVYRHQK